MLELKNINVSFRSERQDKIFGHTRQQVLFDVSLTVKDGTCLGILGESGSGKSTMGRVLCGLLKPDSGEVVLDGVSVYAPCRTAKSAKQTQHCVSGLHDVRKSPVPHPGYYWGRPDRAGAQRGQKTGSENGNKPFAGTGRPACRFCRPVSP